VVLFGLAISGLVFGLSQGQPQGWGSPETLVPLGASLAAFVLFVFVERRAAEPLINFRLFRHLNFLAANISQVLAGMIELGLGFLMPYYMLLVIGVDPAIAGIALIPGTLPIIAAGPLAGHVFDRVGGRIPLVGGFLILAASGAALAIGAGEATVPALIPGLLLQGLGLGIVLTVNDPTGLMAVPESDSGQASGMINTAEQMGGAIGIAALTALELGYYFHLLNEKFAARGIDPTPEQYDEVHNFILEAEQKGLENVHQSKAVQVVIDDLVTGHIDAFQLTFYASGGIALVGAIACFLLVRRTTRVAEGPIFGRRSRWILSNVARTPGLTRHRPADGSDQSSG
jgi:MFS family permease